MVIQLRNDLAESRATELALRRECVELAYQSPNFVDSSKVSTAGILHVVMVDRQRLVLSTFG